MKEANTKARKTKVRGTVNGVEQAQLAQLLVKHGQLILPMVGLIEQSRLAVNEVIDVTGRAVIEAVLMLSAQELAGAKSQGRRRAEENGIAWYGKQWGSVALSDRKLAVERPRLRSRGAASREVTVPAYAAMRDDSELGARMLGMVLGGVSTRNYEGTIRDAAEAAGISKSSVSREFIEQSAEKLRELAARRFTDREMLAVYLDGIQFGPHHVLAAVGIDGEGRKHVLGIASGSSENTVVVKGLLTDLVERGLDPAVARLFIIDGSKALAKGVREVFGEKALIQRCRLHKIRNVVGYLPEHLRDQVTAVMRAAYKLPYKEGIGRLKTQAAWLEKEYPQAAASLLEGLEETFTVNQLGLSPALIKCLATTNIIENPNGTVRRQTWRVSRWQDGAMVMRWSAAAFLNAEKKFRRVAGHKELWMLRSALGLTDKFSPRPVVELEEIAKVA